METNEFHFGQGQTQAQPLIEAVPLKESHLEMSQTNLEVPQSNLDGSQPNIEMAQMNTEPVHDISDKIHGGGESKVVEEKSILMETEQEMETQNHQTSPVKLNDVTHSPVKQNEPHNDSNSSHNDLATSQNDVASSQNDVVTKQNDVASSENDVSSSEHNNVGEEGKVENHVEAEETNEEVMEQDQPDSTPKEEVEKDGGEGETHVEEHVEQDGHVEESTTVPVIEEPNESEENQTQHHNNVEISDVTQMEEETKVEEVEKSDEEILMDHINSAYQCLDDYMTTVSDKSAVSEDHSKIEQCMSLLKDIKALTEKTRPPVETDAKTPSTKKGKKGSKSSSQTKASSKNHVEHDPLEEVNLKDISGLCVFAKWPNSGWFYPGVVRDLTLEDWKSSASSRNLTVTFYDGLERDMKCINIFPASLIPSNSILFDLDQETDLTNHNTVQQGEMWVQYSVTSGGESEEQVKDFDKMAIKGVQMKNIKHNYETTNSNNKQETLVTGRRVRGKSSMFNEDYVSTSSPRQTEKRKGNQVDDNTPAKPPAKRKSSSKEDDDSAESTPSRSTSKRRQVNGTKSTPRRSSKK